MRSTKKSVTVIAIVLFALGLQVSKAEDHKHDDHAHGETETCSKDKVASGQCKPELKTLDAHKEKKERHAHDQKAKDDNGESHNSDRHTDEHEDEAEGEASASVGPGKAVTEIQREGEKFKLSPDASSKIGLKFAQARSLQGGSIAIPKTALVEYQDKTAVYRLNGQGFIELIPVSVQRRKDNQLVIRAQSLSPSDKIAISGVPLLRAAQLEAFGQGGHGHAH